MRERNARKTSFRLQDKKIVFSFQFTVNKKYKIKEMQDKKTGYKLQVKKNTDKKTC